MRTCLLFATAGALLAQSASSSFTTDINGNKIPGGETIAANGVVTDLRRSINGKEVPLEQVEEKVLSKSGNTTVTERIIRHYGSNGQVALTERVVNEETKTGEGEFTSRSTTYRSDISGNMAEAERRTIDVHKVGATIATDAVLEKKGLNGSFEIAEKRTATKEPTADGKRVSDILYLRDANGGLYEAQRSATTEIKTGNQTVASTAIYEPNLSGQLSLTRQNVVKTTANPDGSSSQEIETFGRISDGRARPAGSPPALTEVRTISRQKGPGGAVIETQTVQLPSVNDPNRLEPAHKVSETICRGECDKNN